jgi:predicted TIM-barrel fold metal-dependent hydrolase
VNQVKIIDAHVHLWQKQQGRVNGLPVYGLGGGKSQFGAEVRQMLPPYMNDGVNSAERLLANMDFAQVAGAVVTQEYIDGSQDEYLRQVRAAYPHRFRVTALYEEAGVPDTQGVDGIKLCGGRMKNPDLTACENVFLHAEKNGLFIAIDMADGDTQAASLREMARQHPRLPIAIGHFGMVTRPNWQEQIKLARLPNVYVESGGITWLFNSEFYPYPSAVRSIAEARDICGMEKLMWGSDYPRTMTAITYRMSWDFIGRSPLLADAEKRQFFYDNAQRFYGFEDLPEMPYIHHMAE